MKSYPTAEEYKLDLANGRIDAVNDDIMVLKGWVESPEGACCKILGPLHRIRKSMAKVQALLCARAKRSFATS